MDTCLHNSSRNKRRNSDKVNDKELKALEALEKKEGGSKID